MYESGTCKIVWMMFACMLAVDPKNVWMKIVDVRQSTKQNIYRCIWERNSVFAGVLSTIVQPSISNVNLHFGVSFLVFLSTYSIGRFMWQKMVVPVISFIRNCVCTFSETTTIRQIKLQKLFNRETVKIFLPFRKSNGFR